MVMDETYVMNQCKEDVCYVSTQFNKDMKLSRLVQMASTYSHQMIVTIYLLISVKIQYYYMILFEQGVIKEYFDFAILVLGWVVLHR